VYKHDTLRLVICGNKCVKAMELVETVRDVEAVVHGQKRVVGEVGGGGGGRTGMVVNDERLSDLRGVYIPPWALRILARSRSTSAANESTGAARGVLQCAQ